MQTLGLWSTCLSQCVRQWCQPNLWMVLSSTQAPLSMICHGVFRHDRCLRDSEASFAPQTPRKVAIIFHPRGELKETPGESTRAESLPVGREGVVCQATLTSCIQPCWESWAACCLSSFLSLHDCLLGFIMPMCFCIFCSSWKIVQSILAEPLSKWSV